MQFEHVYTKQVKIKCFSTVSETSPSDTGIMFPTGSNSASDSSNSLLLLKPPPGTELPRSASVGSAVPRPRPQVGIWWKKKVFVGLVGEIWLRVAFFNFFVAIFFSFSFFSSHGLLVHCCFLLVRQTSHLHQHHHCLQHHIQLSCLAAWLTLHQ